MARILILIGGHLCNAPRPQKEADALAMAGHDVLIRGCWFDSEFVERDRHLLKGKPWQFEPILDFRPIHRWQNLNIRSQVRLAKSLFQRFGFFSPDLLGFGARAMVRTAHEIRADLTIVHSEAGLWAGDRLLNEGFRVGVDFEDWFSEDLLPNDRAARPIAQLKQLEARLLRDCAYCLTTSHALAKAMSTTYQTRQPAVVYNTFPWAERHLIDGQMRDRKNPDVPSLHWFSQTIGPGRGLEMLFHALPHLPIPVEIHLRGNCPAHYRQWLDELIPDAWRDRVFVHSTVANAELISRIAEHDVGLALECSTIPSRDLTVTNKLFQYLQAGLAIVATDTAGQQEVFSKCPGIGQLISEKDPEALALALKELLGKPVALSAAKAASLEAAQTQYCWEKQSSVLLTAAETALS